MASKLTAGSGLVVVAGLSFALAAWFTWKALGPARAASVAAPAASEEVVVAARTLPAFVAIPKGAVRLQPYPRKLVPAGAETSPTAVVGRFPLATIPAGEPVVAQALADPGQAPLVAALLRPGEAAVNVQFAAAAVAGGWLRPGVAVTLYAVTAKSAVKLVAGARVLAVNGQLSPNVPASSGASVVTFAVPQSAVPAVLQAAAANTLQPVLPAPAS